MNMIFSKQAFPIWDLLVFEIWFQAGDWWGVPRPPQAKFISPAIVQRLVDEASFVRAGRADSLAGVVSIISEYPL